MSQILSMLNPRSLATPLQKVAAAALLAGLLCAGVGSLGATLLQERELAALESCEGEASADCLTERSGEIDRPTTSSETRYFYPDDVETGDDERDRINGLSDRDRRELSRDVTATGLYRDGEYVGVRVGRDEYWNTSIADAGTGWLVAFGIGVVLLVGGAGVLVLERRRS